MSDALEVISVASLSVTVFSFYKNIFPSLNRDVFVLLVVTEIILHEISCFYCWAFVGTFFLKKSRPTQMPFNEGSAAIATLEMQMRFM